MPFDPTVAIVFGTLLAALLSSLLYAFWYQSAKFKHSKPGKESASNSLTVSELEAVIQKSVAEATRAFNDRLVTLENQVQSLQRKSNEAARGLLPEREEDFSVRLPDVEMEEEPVVRQKRRVQ